MKNFKLTTGSRRVGRDKEILGPGEYDLDRNFLCRDVGDWNVLGGVPVIGRVRLQGQTLAEIFGLWLQETEILSAATPGDYGYDDRHRDQVNPFEPLLFV